MSSKSAVLIPSATSASVSRAAPRATVLGPLAGIKRVLEESSLLPRPEAAEVPLAHLAGLVQTPALAPLDTVATLLAILLATMVVKTKVLRRGSRLAPLAPSLWLVALSISNPDLSRSRIPQNAISTRLCDVDALDQQEALGFLLARRYVFPVLGNTNKPKLIHHLLHWQGSRLLVLLPVAPRLSWGGTLPVQALLGRPPRSEELLVQGSHRGSSQLGHLAVIREDPVGLALHVGKLSEDGAGKSLAHEVGEQGHLEPVLPLELLQGPHLGVSPVHKGVVVRPLAPLLSFPSPPGVARDGEPVATKFAEHRGAALLEPHEAWPGIHMPVEGGAVAKVIASAHPSQPLRVVGREPSEDVLGAELAPALVEWDPRND
mmetsp:Transcript_221/g.864  ORF Transcript_221/g.864 Transcript_221/m.864 type:complete len:375 (+) Transcript_221:1983-3107(+)